MGTVGTYLVCVVRRRIFEGECDGSGGRGQTNRWQVRGLKVSGGGCRDAVVLGENFVKSRKGAQGPGAGRR